MIKKKKKPYKKPPVHEMTKSQLINYGNELKQLTDDDVNLTMRMNKAVLKREVRRLMKSIKKPIKRASSEESQKTSNPPSETASLYASKKDDAENPLIVSLQKQIHEMQGRRHNVGDEVIVTSPIDKSFLTDGVKRVVAVLEEEHGMCRYFLEGTTEPVEGRHLRLYRGVSALQFTSPIKSTPDPMEEEKTGKVKDL